MYKFISNLNFIDEKRKIEKESHLKKLKRRNI